MTMQWQIEPMDRWPYPETKIRKVNPFRAKFDNTLTLLEDELEHLEVAGAVAVRVVAREADVRRDGMLRARADVRHPGVVLSFHSAKSGSLTYPCDQFLGRWHGEVDWQVNLRAIALGLEALRKVDRYGITERGEQYAGFKALPAGRAMPASHMTRTEAAQLLERVAVGSDLGRARDQLIERLLTDRDELARTLRHAKAEAHPDRRDGDRALWDLVEQAATVLGTGRG